MPTAPIDLASETVRESFLCVCRVILLWFIGCNNAGMGRAWDMAFASNYGGSHALLCFVLLRYLIPVAATTTDKSSYERHYPSYSHLMLCRMMAKNRCRAWCNVAADTEQCIGYREPPTRPLNSTGSRVHWRCGMVFQRHKMMMLAAGR